MKEILFPFYPTVTPKTLDTKMVLTKPVPQKALTAFFRILARGNKGDSDFEVPETTRLYNKRQKLLLDSYEEDDEEPAIIVAPAAKATPAGPVASTSRAAVAGMAPIAKTPSAQEKAAAEEPAPASGKPATPARRKHNFEIELPASNKKARK
ncbi:hypothetical protein Rhopal_001244-T1 [Rhodotorula paludigena]|uniref:Uncharacterized protein n=1 Tax=Rhodotorula paludigena TaxID=86838 RepID=A0AAV5GG97_9BASI|nr:hypothetical protein Rhopal_001244-T1 [Rhodotorula paludigena]